MSRCPQCQQELAPFEYGELGLLQCVDCRGFWFRNGMFSKAKQQGFSGLYDEECLKHASDFSPASSSNHQNMLCPECAISLSPYIYAYSSDIELLRCSDCKGIWADCAALCKIEELLTGYKESLDEAKAKALPLMLQVKRQIQKEEQVKEDKRKREKKRGLFKRFRRQKDSENRKIEDIFQDFHNDRKK